jgi:hypothetical protein
MTHVRLLQDIWELIRDCTASDPEKRPTAKVHPRLLKPMPLQLPDG